MSYVGTLTLGPLAANRIYQRDTRTGGAFGKGAGAVPLSITISAPVASLELQLRDANSPTSVLVPWLSIATDLPFGPQTVIALLPANKAWYLVDLRANGDAGSVVSSTGRVGVGEIIAAAGQSLTTDFWDTSASGDTTSLSALNVAPSPYSAAFASWNGVTTPAGWSTPADGGAYRSCFAAELLRLVVMATGVNAALVGYAYSGTAIASWQPGQANYSALSGVLAQAGGKFGVFIWCQGHQDAKVAGVAGAAYLASLQQLIAAIASGAPIPFARILCSIPAIGTAAASRYDPGSIETVRRAHLQYVQLDPLSQYVAGLDVALASDGIHPSQAGNITFARHFYRAVVAGLGLRAYGDAGPRVSSVARAPGSGRVLLTIAGAPPLTSAADPTPQFQVYVAGQTTGALPIASVDVTQRGFVFISLSSVPPNSQALDVWYRPPFDSASAIGSGIYDMITDGDGLTTGRQLAFFADPLTVPAPNWHRPLLLRPGVVAMLAPNIPAFAL